MNISQEESMIAKVNWKRATWYLGVMLIGSLAGAFVATSLLSAGPISSVNPEENTSTKTRWKAAKYVPNTLAVYTIQKNDEVSQSEPVVILIGQVLADVVLPGQDSTKRVRGLAYMNLNQDDLVRFPHALMAVHRDEITCDVIDTANQVQGLDQIRASYAKAFGLEVEELPPIEN